MILYSFFPDSQNAVLLYLLTRLIPCGKATVQRKRKRTVEEERAEKPNPAVIENIQKEDDLIRILKNDPYRSAYMLQIPVRIETINKNF